VIAAAGADELKHAGVAAFHPAIGDTDRAAAHEGRPAMPGLTGQGERQEDLSTGTQPRITPMTRAARCRVSARDRNQPGTGHDLRDRRAAHFTHRQSLGSPARPVRLLPLPGSGAAVSVIAT
jgi:hypothetical protein